MKTYIVDAPVKEYTGEVAGVSLVKGHYSGPLTPSALAYFQGAGYSVTEEAATIEPDPDPVDVEPVAMPSRGASKTDWVAYASQEAPISGEKLTAEQADKLTRDQLAEKYLGPKED